MAAQKNLVARWIREQIEGEKEVSLTNLTDRAVGHFLEDRDFVARFLSEHFREIVYFVAQQVVADTRKGTIMVGDDLLPAEQVRRKALEDRPRWREWLEFTGERHMLIMAMTRRELLAAADIRQNRGAHELRVAASWRRLAEGLVGDQTVGDVYDEAQLVALLDQTIGGQDDGK